MKNTSHRIWTWGNKQPRESSCVKLDLSCVFMYFFLPNHGWQRAGVRYYPGTNVLKLNICKNMKAMICMFYLSSCKICYPQPALNLCNFLSKRVNILCLQTRQNTLKQFIPFLIKHIQISSWQYRLDVNTWSLKMFVLVLVFIQNPAIQLPDRMMQLKEEKKNLQQGDCSVLSLHPAVYYLISSGLGHTATLNGPRPHGQQSTQQTVSSQPAESKTNTGASSLF